MKKAIVVITFFALIGGCTNTDSTQDTHAEQKDNITVNQDSLLAASIEKRLNVPRDYLLTFNKGIKAKTKTVYFSCSYSQNNKLVKLTIVTLLHADSSSFSEEFFYDFMTNSIIYKYGIAPDDTSYTILNADRNVISFVRQKEHMYMNTLNNETKESKVSAIMLILESGMAFFPRIEYMNIKPSMNSLPVLQTQNVIPLKDSPSINGKTTAMLQTDTRLLYLGTSKNTSEYLGNEWTWYYVATEDKKFKGWIFGHPNVVSELNDENY